MHSSCNSVSIWNIKLRISPFLEISDLWLGNNQQNWKILKEMGISDDLTYLLRNLYAGQEATVRTRHGKTDWSQIGKGVRQGRLLSPCLFNFNAEYMMRNVGLDETQAGIKISRRHYQ